MKTDADTCVVSIASFDTVHTDKHCLYAAWKLCGLSFTGVAVTDECVITECGILCIGTIDLVVIVSIRRNCHIGNVVFVILKVSDAVICCDGKLVITHDKGILTIFADLTCAGSISRTACVVIGILVALYGSGRSSRCLILCKVCKANGVYINVASCCLFSSHGCDRENGCRLSEKA